MTYQIQDISEWTVKSIESRGTKAKHWVLQPAPNISPIDQIPYLFKETKKNTGEDWSELVACKLALLLEIPCADYELASYKGQRGVITPLFLPPAAELIDGVEYMAERVSDYENQKYFKRSEHTLDLVLDIIKTKMFNPPIGYSLPQSLNSATDVFLGYLMLDALVGNGDRHDQNWAAIRLQTETLGNSPGLYLAPTFDHAACLGRELLDSKRHLYLTTQNIEAYLARNHSAFYRTKYDKKPMLTIDAFRHLDKVAPSAGQYWRSRLERLSNEELTEPILELPDLVTSREAKDFCRKMLQLRKSQILEQ